MGSCRGHRINIDEASAPEVYEGLQIFVVERIATGLVSHSLDFAR